jgi:hypothetical protein
MLETMGKAHGWGTFPKCRVKLGFRLLISVFKNFFQGCLIGDTQPGRVYNAVTCKFSEWNKLAVFIYFG